MDHFQMLADKNLIQPPKWLVPNTQWVVMMGSVAYGCSSDTSDVDLYGFAIPPKDMVFPHLAGEILDFGRQKKRFNQYQQAHIKDIDALAGGGREYDITIYGIVRYFHLLLDNNPNIIDSLFVPLNCILKSTSIGNLVREYRRNFLHKGSWPRFKGYSFSQLNKMRSKNPIGKRVAIREEFGFDVKFAAHVVRLLDEAEQILTTGDIDLQRNKEQLKAIRRGEVSEEEIRKWAADKELQLEKIYAESKLPWGPDEAKIKDLLLKCLEQHYGSLDKCIVHEDVYKRAIDDIRNIVNRVPS